MMAILIAVDFIFFMISSPAFDFSPSIVTTSRGGGHSLASPEPPHGPWRALPVGLPFFFHFKFLSVLATLFAQALTPASCVQYNVQLLRLFLMYCIKMYALADASRGYAREVLGQPATIRLPNGV